MYVGLTGKKEVNKKKNQKPLQDQYSRTLTASI